LNFKLKSLDLKAGNPETWKVKVAAASAETGRNTVLQLDEEM